MSRCATPARWRIDGDTYEIVNVVDSGYAVPTPACPPRPLRYVIGRDGKLALLLWMEKTDKVAEVQLCYDAVRRSEQV